MHALTNKRTDTEQPLWQLCQAHRKQAQQKLTSHEYNSQLY